jgi:hypothetical protein
MDLDPRSVIFFAEAAQKAVAAQNMKDEPANTRGCRGEDMRNARRLREEPPGVGGGGEGI